MSSRLGSVKPMPSGSDDESPSGNRALPTKSAKASQSLSLGSTSHPLKVSWADLYVALSGNPLRSSSEESQLPSVDVGIV